MTDESTARDDQRPPAPAQSPALDSSPSVDGEQYRQLVELSPDLVLLLDEDAVVRYANLAATDVLRVDAPHHVHGRALASFFVDPEANEAQAAIARIRNASGETPIEEARFRRDDGSWFHAEMIATPFVHAGRHVSCLVVRDVTRRKEAEQARRKLRWLFLATAGLLGLSVVTSGSYRFYEYTESVEFCGRLCHSVMGPELALHQRSSHSHVPCAECHIGHGAAWYVKAKLSGLRQVYAAATGRHSRPIPTPISNLRPASETCEECHSGRVYYGNRERVSFRYPADGGLDDPEVTLVRFHVGGYKPDTDQAAGIHWHAGHGAIVEYRTDDPRRLQIREIRVTERGESRTYVQRSLPELPAGTPWRTMDCSDCHNRVAHEFESPEQAVDRLIFLGRLDRSLPELRKAALDAVTREYPSTAAARDGIRSALEDYYRRHLPNSPATLSPRLAATADTLFELAYRLNVSPEMRIGWQPYVQLHGHEAGTGCFRCHDDAHSDEGGKAIGMDCERCHELLLDGVRLQTLDAKTQQQLLPR